MATEQPASTVSAAGTGTGPTTAAAAAAAANVPLPVKRPRVAIQFCTQCKWLLRAAYYAQELLSTFGPALGEVALQPATGGVFRVTIEGEDGKDGEDSMGRADVRLLWDRTVDGGFPETKELKRRVRDVVAPGRDLGHVDRTSRPAAAAATTTTAATPAAPSAPAALSTTTAATSCPTPSPGNPVCEDCQ